jgi:hypothetical protein
MTHILKRALPFILAFVFGVMITAIIGRISPIRHTRGFDCGVPRSNWKSQTVEIWELQDPGKVLHMPITAQRSHSSMLTLKEQALLARASRDSERGGPTFVVDYVSPEPIDGGGEYTSNVMISNIPRPAFWDKHLKYALADCNTLVRVDLDASGRVSSAQPVLSYGDQCPYLSDILDAAREISFSPALRDGVPVTLRMSMMYRARRISMNEYW